MKARLLLVLKWVGAGATVAFFAEWVMALVAHPWPKWLMPASVVMVGVAFASVLLYHLINHLVGEPIEAPPHWELKTPTNVSNLLKQNPLGPFVVWIVFVVSTYAGLHAKNTLHLRSITAALFGLIIGTAVWWLLMVAFAKGWVRDED
jgi:hypothetical protein